MKKHFPVLTDRNFANSRDANFEEHILKETDGYGVDIVLNCLVEEKLRASIRCLSKWGKFLEIGKYDIMENNLIDTTSLGDNKTLHVICLAHLYAETVKNPVDDNRNVQIWKRICNLLREGIESNQVRPLNYTIFSKDECEKAFHYMVIYSDERFTIFDVLLSTYKFCSFFFESSFLRQMANIWAKF